MPGLSTFAWHVEEEDYLKRAEAEEATLDQWPNTSLGDHRRRNPPCNAEDHERAEHLAIEDWFRGYCGSPGLRGPRESDLLSMGQTNVL